MALTGRAGQVDLVQSAGDLPERLAGLDQIVIGMARQAAPLVEISATITMRVASGVFRWKSGSIWAGGVFQLKSPAWISWAASAEEKALDSEARRNTVSTVTGWRVVVSA